MTQQRDLKRRIRARQAETGESYVTARRHVLAQRPTEPEPDPIAVVEPTDATEIAAQLGLRCRVLIFPKLVARLGPQLLLERVRDALLVADAEPLRDLAFRGQSKPMPRVWAAERADAQRFRERLRAGIGGVSRSGYCIALHVEGVPVLCNAWHFHLSRPPVMVVMTLDEHGAELWGQGL